jgi:hypothetical protein
MVNNHTARLLLLNIFATGAISFAQPAQRTLVAFVEDLRDDAGRVAGGDIYMIDSQAGGVRRLTNNRFQKYSPLWSPDGRKLAYLEDITPNIRLPQVVVIGTTGEVRTIQRVFPDKVPGSQVKDLVPRGISLLGWVGTDSVAIEGDFTRWVCLYTVMDVLNGQISDVQVGQCGTFQRSPDGLHVLAEANLRAQDEPTWRDGLQMDGKRLYPKGGMDARMLSVPVWSPDSNAVAVLERVVQSGKIFLAVIPLSGEARRIPLPDSATATEIHWLDVNWIVVGKSAVDLSKDELMSIPERMSERISSELLGKQTVEKMRSTAVARAMVASRLSASDVWVAR